VVGEGASCLQREGVTGRGGSEISTSRRVGGLAGSGGPAGGAGGVEGAGRG